MTAAEFLIFRSRDFLFALPSSVVAAVSEQSDLAGISFSRFYFQAPEREGHQVMLAEGYVLFVGEVLEIRAIAEDILPVPGYIFESDPDWLRGMLWYNDRHVLLLNEQFLLSRLAEYVPEFSV